MKPITLTGLIILNSILGYLFAAIEIWLMENKMKEPNIFIGVGKWLHIIMEEKDYPLFGQQNYIILLTILGPLPRIALTVILFLVIIHLYLIVFLFSTIIWIIFFTYSLLCKIPMPSYIKKEDPVNIKNFTKEILGLLNNEDALGKIFAGILLIEFIVFIFFILIRGAAQI